MNEEQGTTAEADQDMGSDIERAAAILREADEHARRQLRYRYPILFTTWGVAYLLAYGACWLSVLGQHPYQGPTPTALLTLSVVVAAAVGVTVVLVGRAASGVGGTSARQRRVYVLSSIIGFAGLYAVEAALDHAGASLTVLGVYGATAPLLLTGLIVALGAAIALDWAVLGLGSWLIAVGASSGFAGGRGAWGIDALAGSAGFLALAVIRFRHRS